MELAVPLPVRLGFQLLAQIENVSETRRTSYKNSIIITANLILA